MQNNFDHQQLSDGQNEGLSSSMSMEEENQSQHFKNHQQKLTSNKINEFSRQQESSSTNNNRNINDLQRQNIAINSNSHNQQGLNTNIKNLNISPNRNNQVNKENEEVSQDNITIVNDDSQDMISANNSNLISHQQQKQQQQHTPKKNYKKKQNQQQQQQQQQQILMEQHAYNSRQYDSASKEPLVNINNNKAFNSNNFMNNFTSSMNNNNFNNNLNNNMNNNFNQRGSQIMNNNPNLKIKNSFLSNNNNSLNNSMINNNNNLNNSFQRNQLFQLPLQISSNYNSSNSKTNDQQSQKNVSHSNLMNQPNIFSNSMNSNIYAFNNESVLNRIQMNNNNSSFNSSLKEPLYDKKGNQQQLLDQSQQQQGINNNKQFGPMEIQYLKNANKIIESNFFYYPLPYSYHSNPFPTWNTPLGRALLFQFALPYLICFLLLILIWGIQKAVEDFCFYNVSATSSANCQCSNFGSKIWTFFKQMASWKLGVISCKNIVLIEISQEKKPLLESLMIFIIGIGVDFIMVVALGLTEDWHFYVAMSIIGLTVSIHTIKFKQLSQIFQKGRGLLLYDVNLIGLICFGYFALPGIYNDLVYRYSFVDGRNAFLYLYPLLEFIMDVFTDQILNLSIFAEFYEYQLQMFILGMRVGIMTSISIKKFEFWYLGVFFLLKKTVGSTGVLYINIRKAIYFSVPQSIRYYVAMKEVPDFKKGKEGFNIENLLWLILYYWWLFTNSLIPGVVKNVSIINDCTFGTSALFHSITWDKAFFTWLFQAAGTFLSLLMNSYFKYDMIKWVGSPSHNIIENIFSRMFGWYLFQIALATAYSFSNEVGVSQF